MGKETSIEWTDHTFSPWWGCQRVSPGCVHCYAETLAKRRGKDVWGPAKTTARMPTSDAYWRGPVKWDRKAREEGRRARVFCASMADVFEDHPQLPPLRARLFELIEATPNLDWQLLTKRPENMAAMAPESWRDGWPRNVWAGTSVEDQERADERIRHLLRVPAAVRFLSCEPLLSAVNLRLTRAARDDDYRGWDGDGPIDYVVTLAGQGIHWCIIGGESGPGARAMDVGWARSLVGQCRAAGVAPFVKQLGAVVLDRNDAGFDADTEWETETGRWTNQTGWPSTVWVEHNPRGFREEHQGAPVRVRLRDRKGGDMEEWPMDLRVREFPDPAHAR